jgi:hypothetical protein
MRYSVDPLREVQIFTSAISKNTGGILVGGILIDGFE